ncbi:hydrophobic protein [Streptomyces sp. NBC_01275]|uniref:hydrophobic protein n=1 Tax=Streptomyces sp. NBC_01275 TaxID=2903807 RepID=UPI002258C6FD|nr:hydrophobic protein [Streptomyces sp. NBC_01275]MCX4761788.1 hydrophobic protein [Streptomyces sp. NBC_01275]
MILWILLFLLILVVFGIGFTMQALWWVAAVLLVVWIVGFAMRGRGGGRRSGGSRRYGRSRG